MKNNTNHFYNEFKKTFVSISDKNWYSKLSSYIENIKSFSGNAEEKRMIAGWMAALCERAYYISAYKKDTKTRFTFATRLEKLMNSASLPKSLTCPGPVICGKRQPSLIKTITPTLDRFDVIEQLPEVFGNSIDSIIIGGSMSYIPFFGIRENQKIKDFSDIDTLIVINDDFFKKSSWIKFIKSDLFPDSDKKIFLNRIKIFQKLYLRNKADVFSQRFSIIGKGFTISNHFLTRSVFSRMIDTDLRKALRTKKDTQYIMRDFRTDPFRHPCHARHTFNGNRFESTIDGHDVKLGGFISDMPGFIISNSKFYPGVYQTVISPGLLTFYDRTGETRKLVKKFEKILYREVDNERKKFPTASYAKAHNRYDIFPPGRYNDGHNSYVSPEKIKKCIASSGPDITKVESKLEQGELISKKLQYSEKNEFVRDKAIKLLNKWKKETLKNAEKEIKGFIYRSKKIKSTIASAKKQENFWHTVVTIPSIKQIIINLPDPYKQEVNSNLAVHEEILTYKITPTEIMRLNSYEELAQISKKVYVATVTDPKNKSILPIAYNLVIPIS